MQERSRRKRTTRARMPRVGPRRPPLPRVQPRSSVPSVAPWRSAAIEPTAGRCGPAVDGPRSTLPECRLTWALTQTHHFGPRSRYTVGTPDGDASRGSGRRGSGDARQEPRGFPVACEPSARCIHASRHAGIAVAAGRRDPLKEGLRVPPSPRSHGRPPPDQDVSGENNSTALTGSTPRSAPSILRACPHRAGGPVGCAHG